MNNCFVLDVDAEHGCQPAQTKAQKPEPSHYHQAESNPHVLHVRCINGPIGRWRKHIPTDFVALDNGKDAPQLLSRVPLGEAREVPPIASMLLRCKLLYQPKRSVNAHCRRLKYLLLRLEHDMQVFLHNFQLSALGFAAYSCNFLRSPNHEIALETPEKIPRKLNEIKQCRDGRT